MVLIVIVIIITQNKKNNKPNSPTTTATTTNGKKDSNISSNNNNISSSPPTLLTSLSLLDEDKERMKQEFESIKKPELTTTTKKSHKHHQRHYSHNDLDNRKHDEEKFFSALQPNNYGKNRYHDVLPNESTRVRLTPIESGDGDYINANYINGEVPNSYRYYIACQAPLPSTIKDFWRMVWEERSSVIVCLTKTEENGKKKADIYWPETSQQPQEYGSFWVHLHKKVMFKDIGVSSLHLYKKGEEFPREVVLLHYTQWPDCGAPPSSSHIRTLSVMVNTFKQRGNTKQTNGPVIVHCSAGIGRSGTFISINIHMAKIERFGSDPSLININVKESVVELRRQRKGMVQTLDQYLFIYKVINDVLSDLGIRSLASPSKRRSCEIIKNPNLLASATLGNSVVNNNNSNSNSNNNSNNNNSNSNNNNNNNIINSPMSPTSNITMPRLDITNQPPLTFTTKDFQSSISPSTDTVASLSIITQMTQTLKFPQAQPQDNPFSKSSLKIPSPCLNVSNQSIPTQQQFLSASTGFPIQTSTISTLSCNHLFLNNSTNGSSSNINTTLNGSGNITIDSLVEQQKQQQKQNSNEQCQPFSIFSSNNNHDNNNGNNGNGSSLGGGGSFNSSLFVNSFNNNNNNNNNNSNNNNNNNSSENQKQNTCSTTTTTTTTTTTSTTSDDSNQSNNDTDMNDQQSPISTIKCF